MIKKIKTILLLLPFLLANTGILKAQEPYTCVTKGAILEYAQYNEADQLEKYVRQTINDVSNLSGGNYDLRIGNSTIKKPGQKKDGDDGYVTYIELRGGCVEYKPFLSNRPVSIIEGGEIILMPNKIAVGYQLPIGDMRVEDDGMAMVANLSENEIIGRDEVTTPAGTFKCYILKQTLTAMMMGMPGPSTVTKTWFSRGVGVVKSEVLSEGRLINRLELVTYLPEGNSKKK